MQNNVLFPSRSDPVPMPADLPGGLTADMLEQAWRAGQAWLTTLLPGTPRIIARESEHDIQLQQPDLVIEAIRDVVDAVRDPASWESATPRASG